MYLLSKLSKEMQNKKHNILLSVGSNTGKSIVTINRSVKLISNSDRIFNLRFSSFYNTSPVGYTQQNDFINAAIFAETTFNPEELLFFLKSIEYSLGRKVRKRWHEREIDIDIILFGNLVINYRRLTIPHKEMYKRMFVLSPANEIAPDFLHPVLNKNINELYRAYKGNEKVIKM